MLRLGLATAALLGSRCDGAAERGTMAESWQSGSFAPPRLPVCISCVPSGKICVKKASEMEFQAEFHEQGVFPGGDMVVHVHPLLHGFGDGFLLAAVGEVAHEEEGLVLGFEK